MPRLCPSDEASGRVDGAGDCDGKAVGITVGGADGLGKGICKESMAGSTAQITIDPASSGWPS